MGLKIWRMAPGFLLEHHPLHQTAHLSPATCLMLVDMGQVSSEAHCGHVMACELALAASMLQQEIEGARETRSSEPMELGWHGVALGSGAASCKASSGALVRCTTCNKLLLALRAEAHKQECGRRQQDQKVKPGGTATLHANPARPTSKRPPLPAPPAKIRPSAGHSTDAADPSKPAKDMTKLSKVCPRLAFTTSALQHPIHCKQHPKQ